MAAPFEPLSARPRPRRRRRLRTHLNTLVTKVPLGASMSVAMRSASSTSQDCE
jgi:hypothetical protein